MNAKPLPRAMLFDMDGTIVDWQTGMEEHWRAACDVGCSEYADLDPTALHEAIKVRREWFWADPERARTGRLDLEQASIDIVRHAFDDLAISPADPADAIALNYRARRLEALALYPRAIDTLETLQRHGVAMALVTNGGARAQRHTIERFRLDRFFSCIVVEGEFGAGKPDERVFRHALDALGAAPAEAWMIGDSLEADIATPLQLGMHTVWVCPEEEQRVSRDVRPHRTIREISQLLESDAE